MFLNLKKKHSNLFLTHLNNKIQFFETKLMNNDMRLFNHEASTSNY